RGAVAVGQVAHELDGLERLLRVQERVPERLVPQVAAEGPAERRVDVQVDREPRGTPDPRLAAAPGETAGQIQVGVEGPLALLLVLVGRLQALLAETVAF